MKNSFFIILILFNFHSIQATGLEEIPKLYPKWTFWVPGGTQFYQGRIVEGILFSGLEIGGVITGIVFNRNLKEHSNSPYYNYPVYIGLNMFGVEKCDYLRNRLEYIKFHRPDFQYDDISFHDLMLEPFKMKNILTPVTTGCIALALLELYIESRNSKLAISRVDKIHFLNRYVNRNPGLALYGATGLAMSWQAGVGEEYYMRNYLMPVLDYKYGKNRGLVISSAVFGGMHAFNYLFVEDPDPMTMIYHVTFASVFGYILGRNVQKNHYKIGEAIAAHTWYDFVLIFGSFLVNPKENVFGIDVKVKI